jgi:hypothetical protein
MNLPAHFGCSEARKVFGIVLHSFLFRRDEQNMIPERNEGWCDRVGRESVSRRDSFFHSPIWKIRFASKCSILLESG